jgi:hypothetical protein
MAAERQRRPRSIRAGERLRNCDIYIIHTCTSRSPAVTYAFPKFARHRETGGRRPLYANAWLAAVCTK